MRIIETKVYPFNELSEKAKQKAIEELATINVDYNWWESTYEDAERIGLKITSFDLDRNRYAKGDPQLAANEIAANILRDHGDTCETYKTTEKFMADWQPLFDKYMETEEGEDELLDIESEFIDSLLEDYSMILQKESEYLQSDVSIIETIEANGYEFTEDGKLI